MALDRHMPDPVGSWSIKEGLDDILHKSCRLMARRGFHGTSMRDLAQETGRSLSGLYHYFRSKEDLVFLINLYGFRTLNDTWPPLAGAFDDAYERLYAFIYFHTSYFCEHMDEMRVMTWGTQVLNLEKARMIQKLKDRYTDAAKDVVRRAHEAAGETADDRRLSRRTFLLFGMMNWMFSWYSPDVHGGLDELAGDIYATFTSGVTGGATEAAPADTLCGRVSRVFDETRVESMWKTGGPEPEEAG